MQGTVAITDHGWYQFLSARPEIDEVNFWTPSAHHGFRGEPGAPLFFKLKAKYDHAICGFAHFQRFVRLPDWLAWDCFGEKNGCRNLHDMRERISGIREKIDYHATRHTSEIGCIVLVEPTFFPPESWVRGPADWSRYNLRNKKYDLAQGEGRRVWEDCLAAAQLVRGEAPGPGGEEQCRGEPRLVRPRLGQGAFRVEVMEAYERACAVTGEHSLPALEAAHIRPYSEDGPHDVRNGLFLRADLHGLFDRGYVTITTDHHLEVSPKLKEDYDNGHSYYPMHGTEIAVPGSPENAPSAGFIEWHNEKVFRAA